MTLNHRVSGHFYNLCCKLKSLKSLTYLILIIALSWSCSSKPKHINPKLSNLTESVYSSVTIQPDSLYDVYAAINGILDQFLVSEGDTVQVGQPIAQVINTMPKLNAQNAQVALQLAQQNAGSNSTILGSIKDEIKTAELNAQNARINYERQQSLWDQKIGSKAQLDAVKLAHETAQTQVKMLKDKLKRSQYELNAALHQARIQYQTATTNTQDFTIVSKINGTCYSINKNKGELVNAQMPIATIGSSQNFIVEMLIDEVDIARLKLGQEIIITLDAYKSEIFKAKISKIYPSKNQRTQTFKVEGVFITKPKILYPGLSGEANIIISTKEEVITLPNEYISENNEINTEDGLIKIEVGSKNMERSQILSPIDTSLKVYPLE